MTGGAGFIGSHLVARLARRFEVAVLDDLSTGSRGHLEGVDVELTVGSILDDDALGRTMEGADAVAHLAAIPSVPDSLRDPVRCHRVNAEGTLRVLEAARRHDVGSVVVASSAAVYGDPVAVPVAEDAPTRPRSPYGADKLASEGYARAFHEAYGLSTASLRYFNVYGPRQDPEADYAAAVPAFVTRALAGEPLVVHGDGKQTRDFVYVADVAEATAAALGAGLEGEVLNVASGEATAIGDLARHVRRVAGSSSEIVHGDPRPGDVRRSHAEIAAIREALDWSPTTTLEEGLARTIDAFRDARHPR